MGYLKDEDKAILERLVPVDRGDVARIIETIGPYRATVIRERMAATNQQEKDEAKAKYFATLDEISLVTNTTTIQQCYKGYCDCVINHGTSCSATLQACLDQASATLPLPDLTDSKDRSV